MDIEMQNDNENDNENGNEVQMKINSINDLIKVRDLTYKKLDECYKSRCADQLKMLLLKSMQKKMDDSGLFTKYSTPKLNKGRKINAKKRRSNATKSIDELVSNNHKQFYDPKNNKLYKVLVKMKKKFPFF